MDLSKVRVFAELLKADDANKYIALGWQCVKIATRCAPVGPGSCDCCHVYIMGWNAETPPLYPFALGDDNWDACF